MPADVGATGSPRPTALTTPKSRKKEKETVGTLLGKNKWGKLERDGGYLPGPAIETLSSCSGGGGPSIVKDITESPRRIIKPVVGSLSRVEERKIFRL